MEVIGEDGQEGVADKGHVGQEVGMAGAGAILPQQGVAPPVIADFDPAPVSPDQVQPACELIVPGRRAREVVARLVAGDPGLFDRPFAAQDDQGPGVGEVGPERFEGKGMQVPDLDAPVSRVGVGKKGVPGNRSRPWACLSRFGWLPLIWSR